VGNVPAFEKEMHVPQIETKHVAVLGVQYDASSTCLRGSAHAPEAIRAALHNPSTNLCAENGLDLGSDSLWSDVGDISPDEPIAMVNAVEDAVEEQLVLGRQVVTLGGDHSISFPAIRAYAAKYSQLNVLHLDAHPDLYDEFEGNRLSHACPFARVMEEKLASRLVQVGIRTLNPHQREQAQRFGIEVHEMRDWTGSIDIDLEDPVYVSVDLDCLDPAFAPGVSHHEPGGLATREVLKILRSLGGKIVGADVVELNPQRDHEGMTAMLAAKLLKELISLIIERS
jgi:agmatinase